MKNKKEYRDVRMGFSGGEKRLESDFYAEGYAATFDKPYVLYEFDGVTYYEVIDRGALAGADISDVIMQYDHQGNVLARVSNGTLGIEADESGLFIFADLSKSRASRELYEEITAGLVTKMSWCFTVAEESYDSDTRTRKIHRINKMYDVSAVSIPVNGDTEIVARGLTEMKKKAGYARRRAKVKAGMIKYRR
jgi:HK97 family phage prohead protease